MSRQEREQFCREICFELTEKYHSKCRYKIYPIKGGQQPVTFWFDILKERLTLPDMVPLMTDVPNPVGHVETMFLSLSEDLLPSYKRYWEAMDDIVKIVCSRLSEHFKSDVTYKYVNQAEGEHLQVSLKGNRRILEIPIHEIEIEQLCDLLYSGFAPSGK